MNYVTGICAFGVPDDTKSCGIWNIRKHQYLGDDFLTRESESSVFGEWGIQENKMVPYHDLCTYRVANHVRAYVDMLEMCKFDEMHGLFANAIDNGECRLDIFMLVYGKMRNLPYYEGIHRFMCEEFGNAWTSYIKAIKDNAKVVQDNIIKFNDAVASKKAFERSERMRGRYYEQQ